MVLILCSVDRRMLDLTGKRNADYTFAQYGGVGEG